MLSREEKEYLYQIISAVIGEDASIKAYAISFNENTVLVVEEMVEENFRCNANMKQLVCGLLGSATQLMKGWLNKLLKGTKKKLSKSELKGYGCLVAVKAKWKNAIILSVV